MLRDGRADAEVVFAGDDDAGTVHFGAFEPGAEAPTAVASLYAAMLKEQSHAGGVPVGAQYQFRGMASAPEVRGKGCADAVMRAMIGHVRSRHPGNGRVILWCNARVAAVGFYERFGMRVVGSEFNIPDIGPHVVMVVAI